MTTEICNERHNRIDERLRDLDISERNKAEQLARIIVRLETIQKSIESLTKDVEHIKKGQTIFQVKQGIIWATITMIGVFFVNKVLAKFGAI